MVLLYKVGYVEFLELVVCNAHDECVELLCWQLVCYLNAILVLCNGRVSPWVVNGDVHVVLLECAVDVDNLCVAHVGDI